LPCIQGFPLYVSELLTRSKTGHLLCPSGSNAGSPEIDVDHLLAGIALQDQGDEEAAFARTNEGFPNVNVPKGVFARFKSFAEQSLDDHHGKEQPLGRDRQRDEFEVFVELPGGFVLASTITAADATCLL
jgi:hypothetical protein